MAYFATLKTGVDYTVGGATFLKGQEKEVDENLHEYLSTKENFEVREGESFVDVNENGVDDSEELAELKAKSRDELDEIAADLELDPKDYKNKTELAKAILAKEAELDEE